MQTSSIQPLIYLDHAATTAPEAEVIEAVYASMKNNIYNPSAAYSAAGNSRKALRLTRKAIGELIGCEPNHIYFTSGGTEANNWVFCGLENRHVVLSAIEHASVLQAAENHHCHITLVKPDENGIIHPESIEKALRSDTALISLQYANNETGVLQPVKQVAAIAKSKHILCHCDAVQAVGHVPIDVRTLGVDLLSASAHKLYGPRGIGFLYIRSGVNIPPLLAGGQQENNRRSGTENIPAVEGFGVAAKLAQMDLEPRALREQKLIMMLQNIMKETFPQVKVLGVSAQRTPGICAMLLPGLSSEVAIAKLDLCGIMVSGGAACASSSKSPSHVYRAMGLSEEEAGCVLRFSVGRHTTEAEISTAAGELIRIYKECLR